MPSISTSIRLHDEMSAAIQNIINATNNLNSSWDELNNTTSQTPNLNTSLDEANQQAGDLSTTLGKIGGVLASMAAVKKVVDLSDELTQTTARLNMINDGLVSTDELMDKIMASATRARASFTDMADSVAKLSLNAGEAFSSNDETILFAENLNKLFAISGAEASSISSATLQLTQALGSGVLRGEEFNSVFEAAPNIMQTIADYMGVPIGQLRSMAAEGEITADVVKNALLGATDEINAQFESMPMTWAQVWQDITNKLYFISMPILNAINFLANNIDWILPLVAGLASIVAVMVIFTHTAQIAAFATKVWTAAQAAFNAVMAMNPIAWIIIGIVALIAVIYTVVGVINKATGSTLSAFGIITGALATVGAFIVNLVVGVVNGVLQIVYSFVSPFIGIVEWILNVCNGGFDSFGGAVANLIGNIISWFLQLGQVVTKIIDAIFGTDWTSGLQALSDNVVSWGKNEDAITLNREGPTIDYHIDYGSAYDTGYSWGEGLTDKIGSAFGTSSDAGYDMDSLLSGVSDISDSADSAASSLSTSTEDLKYLRDIAERETINRFTTAEVKVDLGGVTNNVNSKLDLDGVIDYMVTGVSNALSIAAEGVHS